MKMPLLFYSRGQKSSFIFAAFESGNQCYFSEDEGLLITKAKAQIDVLYSQ